MRRFEAIEERAKFADENDGIFGIKETNINTPSPIKNCFQKVIKETKNGKIINKANRIKRFIRKTKPFSRSLSVESLNSGVDAKGIQSSSSDDDENIQLRKLKK